MSTKTTILLLTDRKGKLAGVYTSRRSKDVDIVQVEQNTSVLPKELKPVTVTLPATHTKKSKRVRAHIFDFIPEEDAKFIGHVKHVEAEHERDQRGKPCPLCVAEEKRSRKRKGHKP